MKHWLPWIALFVTACNNPLVGDPKLDSNYQPFFSPTPTPSTSPTATPSPTPTPTPAIKTLDSSWTPEYTNIDDYWSFSGTPGDDLADNTIIPATIGTHDLTYINTAHKTYPSSGILSAPTQQGIAFDGNYLQNGPSLKYGDHQSFSIIGWIRWTMTDDWKEIFSNAHVDQWQKGISIMINPNTTSIGGSQQTGSLFVGMGSVNTLQSESVVVTTTGATYNDGNWHHFAVVFDQINRTLQVFVDGAAVALSQVPGTCGTIGTDVLDYSICSAASTDVQTWVHAYIAGWSGAYRALKGGSGLAEIAVFKTALTASEINTIYQRQK